MRLGRLGSYLAVAVLAATLLANIAVAEEARVEQMAAQRHVTVSGEGQLLARPDIARISSGVVSEAESAKEALSANSAVMDGLLAGLKAAGIASEDIKTTSFDVAPRYQHNRDGSVPRMEGYRVSNDVTVIVRDLARLGPLLDQLVKLGANRIGGLSFDIDKIEALQNEARKKAVANARQRAELYATAAGARIGKVLVISEDVPQIVPRGPMMARAAAAESVPIAEGSQEITARITVTYALE